MNPTHKTVISYTICVMNYCLRKMTKVQIRIIGISIFMGNMTVLILIRGFLLSLGSTVKAVLRTYYYNVHIRDLSLQDITFLNARRCDWTYKNKICKRDPSDELTSMPKMVTYVTSHKYKPLQPYMNTKHTVPMVICDQYSCMQGIDCSEYTNFGNMRTGSKIIQLNNLLIALKQNGLPWSDQNELCLVRMIM